MIRAVLRGGLGGALGLVLTVGIWGCGGDPATATPPGLQGFESEEALRDYVDSLETGAKGNGPFPAAAEGDATGAAAPSTNEGITNNQEAGVDEGGIVKNIGEHLVVLRKGRLYALSVAQAGAPVQTDSIRVAPKEELNQNVWYDEMLVDGNLLYVIGYRYLANVLDVTGTTQLAVHGATEVSLFRLSGGKFVRGSTTFLQSSDYFSGDNYASRLVGGKLVFYMPHPVFTWAPNGRYQVLGYPQKLEHVSGDTFRSTGALFGWQQVKKPLVPPSDPVFHTVTRCGLTAAETLDCDSEALLGAWGREFYVTPSHVFLWTERHVYAFEQATLQVRAHAVRGQPSNQFSFKQEGSTLHVLVTEQVDLRPYGVAVESSTDAAGRTQALPPPTVQLLSLPLGKFDDAGEQVLDDSNTRVLHTGTGGLYVTNNRFAEGYVLASLVTHADWDAPSQVLAHELSSGQTRAFFARGVVTRLEAMPGLGLLASSRSDAGLHLQPFLVSAPTQLQPGVDLPATQEGEWRSHGFFYKPDAQHGGGHFGLPVLSQTPSSGGWWGPGVSNVAFFRATSQGAVSTLGAVSASPASEGVCEVSCIDWYGNTRPIFLKDRVFALMGSELQELSLSAGGVQEVGTRVTLTVPAS